MVINSEKKLEILNQLIQNKNFSFLKDFSHDLSNLKVTLEKQKINKYYFTSFIHNKENELTEGELNQYKNILNLIHDNISYINMINKQYQMLQNGIIKYVYNSISDRIDFELNSFKLSSIKFNVKEYTKLHKTLLKSINANEAKINKVIIHIKNNLFNDDLVTLSKSESLKNIVSNTYTNSIEDIKNEIKNTPLKDAQSLISQDYINDIINTKNSSIKKDKSNNSKTSKEISTLIDNMDTSSDFDDKKLSNILTTKDIEMLKDSNLDMSKANELVEESEVSISLTNNSSINKEEKSDNENKVEIKLENDLKSEPTISPAEIQTADEEETELNQKDSNIDIINEDIDNDLLASLITEEDLVTLDNNTVNDNNNDDDNIKEENNLDITSSTSIIDNNVDVDLIKDMEISLENKSNSVDEIDDNTIINEIDELDEDDDEDDENDSDIIDEKEESLFNDNFTYNNFEEDNNEDEELDEDLDEDIDEDNDDNNETDETITDVDKDSTSENVISLSHSTKKTYYNKQKLVKDNKDLIISEKDKCVYLPYTSNEIYQYIKSYPNFYKNTNDVIKKEFVISSKEFNKHPTKARFNEAYSLLRDKEMCSIFESLKFAFDLMFDYKLHPAIIAACKSLDELADYLDCLDKNTLGDFDHFNIIFEVSPVKSRY